jgi:hypothetical protein
MEIRSPQYETGEVSGGGSSSCLGTHSYFWMMIRSSMPSVWKRDVCRRLVPVSLELEPYMIHDTARVHAIRVRVAAQLDMIKSLEARVIKGKLDALDVARNQTEDIETFFLRDLERQDRTPADESRWLSYAEHQLQTWGPYLREVRERFNKYGDVGVKIVGG